jgi:Regulated-SNARE-like domain
MLNCLALIIVCFFSFYCFLLDDRSNRMAIASDKMVFYYLSRDNLCFLTLCEESYPKRQAFLYLDEIADTIMAELLKEHGANVRVPTAAFLVVVVVVCCRLLLFTRPSYWPLTTA